MKKYIAILAALFILVLIFLSTPHYGLVKDGSYVEEAYYSLGEEATYVDYEPGGKVVLKFRVTKVRLMDFFLYESEKYLDAYKPEKAYLAVDVVATNVGENDAFLPTLKLRADGSVYDCAMYLPVISLILSPGQSVKYTVLFDVPEDISSGSIIAIFDRYQGIKGYWTFADCEKNFHRLKFRIGEGLTFGTERMRYYLEIEDVTDLDAIGQGTTHLYIPMTGYKFVAVKVYVRNVGRDDVYVPYYSDFRLVSGEKEYSPTYLGLKDSYIGGNLKSGSYTSGYIYFELPADVKDYRITVFLVPSQVVRCEWYGIESK
ncbi:hypothetical protein DRP04_11320 [Archaeoglobales archaeon]|nr:MAG: hypothetical protein DRP04_11320 [Archaeoglobales archaeon]